MSEIFIGIIALIVVVATLGVFVVRSRGRSGEGATSTDLQSAETSFPAEPPAQPGPARLRDRLGHAREVFSDFAGSLRAREAIDPETWNQLEETLLGADVGPATTTAILKAVQAQVDKRVAQQETVEPEQLLEILRDELIGRLTPGVRDEPRSHLAPSHLAPSHLAWTQGEVNVWLLVGVNGAGKTTTAGKLAHRYVTQGHRCVLAAADTFRAAAADQLVAWGARTKADVIRAADGSDPGSVVFDAVAAASSRGADIVVVDTAGRLQTKTNLMEELSKIGRVIDRTQGTLQEVLLVMDATTGQNGLAQVRQFSAAVGVTGIVLTKLDGTAKGGIVIAAAAELGIPVKLVGLGEGVDDLVDFDAEEFVDALLGRDS